MEDSTNAFYDRLAQDYHHLFENWEQSIRRQASILGPLLQRYTGRSSPFVLDCACGIGTQTLGLAELGFRLVASDGSRASILRARREAEKRRLDIQFHVADMRDLSPIPASGFDAVLIADNALPHLPTQASLVQALSQIAEKLNDAGIVLATLRDYDRLVPTRPATQAPAFYGNRETRRIVHQVWDWNGDRYTLHLYITMQGANGWRVEHYAAEYRALLRGELTEALRQSGLTEVEWLDAEATSFYQPIVIARRRR